MENKDSLESLEEKIKAIEIHLIWRMKFESLEMKMESLAGKFEILDNEMTSILNGFASLENERPSRKNKKLLNALYQKQASANEEAESLRKENEVLLSTKDTLVEEYNSYEKTYEFMELHFKINDIMSTGLTASQIVDYLCLEKEITLGQKEVILGQIELNRLSNEVESLLSEH